MSEKSPLENNFLSHYSYQCMHKYLTSSFSKSDTVVLNGELAGGYKDLCSGNSRSKRSIISLLYIVNISEYNYNALAQHSYLDSVIMLPRILATGIPPEGFILRNDRGFSP